MTLLQLVALLLEITNSEEETTNLAFDLIASGEVVLTGTLRETDPGHWH